MKTIQAPLSRIEHRDVVHVKTKTRKYKVESGHRVYETQGAWEIWRIAPLERILYIKNVRVVGVDYK